MLHTDQYDILKQRAALIGEVFRDFTEHSVWRWHKYRANQDLYIDRVWPVEGRVVYRRTADPYGGCMFNHLNAVGLSDRKVTLIPVGSEKIIGEMEGTCYNYDGVAPLPVTYSGGMRSLQGAQEAFAFGFTQSASIQLKFKQGPAGIAEFEQQVTLGFESRQDWTRGTTTEKEETHTFMTKPECPPGYDIRYWMRRWIQPMRMKVSGLAKLDHSVQIGKYHSVDGFLGHQGEKKLYPRWAKYDSFYSDFLPTIKGEGPRDAMFFDHFRNHPASTDLITRLEEPLDIPFEHVGSVYDGTIRWEAGEEVLRKRLESS